GDCQKQSGFGKKWGDGLKPDVVACGALIFGLCKNHKVDEAFELALRMLIDWTRHLLSSLIIWKSVGSVTLSCTYSLMHFARQRSVNYYNLAEELFDQMLSTKIVPNVNVYNIMLHNLYSGHQMNIIANHYSSVL
ncbi:hypothetical protein GUJ93_ZPchr0663g11368, partial [Zizania palustris]